MVMRQKLLAFVVAGLLALSVAGGASAKPSEAANCTAREAILGGEPGKPVANAAKNDHPNGPSAIGEAARSDCGRR
jgi:hypothetical protein